LDFEESLRDVGSLDKAKAADIVLIEDNPLEDLAALKNIAHDGPTGRIVFENRLGSEDGERKMPNLWPKRLKKLCQAEIKDKSALPAFCPIKTIPAVVKNVSKRYKKEGVSNFYIRAAITERGCYDEAEAREGRTLPVRPRIREIAEFAKTIGAKKLGLAFCNGLADEAARAAAILEKHGIAVESVVCCCGAVDKTAHGVPA
jgi:hypothetical protein